VNRFLAVLALLIAGALMCLVVLVILSRQQAYAQEGHPGPGQPHWYDTDCCDMKDCYPLPADAYLEERTHGMWYATWISPLDGDKIEGIVRAENVRDSQDRRLHGCQSSYGTPRCIYIHRGA
jgi:hypothetical protein